MNFRRGFRRITLVLSLLAALTAAVLCFFAVIDTWDCENDAYNRQKHDYENIVEFWRVWETDGWIGGKYETVRHLLNLRQSGNEQYQYGSAEFDFGDKVLTLYTHEVFPGIHKDMLYMPSDVLDKEAQAAKEEAVQNAEKQMKQYEWWGKKKSSEVMLLGILAALGGAAVGYLGIWLIVWFGGRGIYKFIRWLALGFRDDPVEQVEKAKPTEKAQQIAERHNKYGVTLTDPRTGEDLLAGMTNSGKNIGNSK